MSAEETPAEDVAPPRRSRKWLWIIIALVILGGGGGGGWWWWHSKSAKTEKKEVPKEPALYYAFDPAFVVNLNEDGEPSRYLQADVQVVTRDPATRTALEQQAPAIRNKLLLLLGQQPAINLSQRQAVEALQTKARAEVSQVLKNEGVPDKVEAVIFTSLVTQ